jgi:hypothetical protein
MKNRIVFAGIEARIPDALRETLRGRVYVEMIETPRVGGDWFDSALNLYHSTDTDVILMPRFFIEHDYGQQPHEAHIIANEIPKGLTPWSRNNSGTMIVPPAETFEVGTPEDYEHYFKSILLLSADFQRFLFPVNFLFLRLVSSNSLLTAGGGEPDSKLDGLAKALSFLYG